MKATIRAQAFIALVLLASGCDGRAPTVPFQPAAVTTPVPAPAPVPPPGPTFFSPPLPPGSTPPPGEYTFANAPGPRPISQFTRESRFVLYEDGTFSLKYAVFEKGYPGSFRMVDGLVYFRWDGSSYDPDAKGSFNEDLLRVRFSFEAQQSDFEDADYMRVR